MALLIADTGPLIAFGSLNGLDILVQLYGQVLIPPAVERELDLDSDRPDSPALREGLRRGMFAVRVPGGTFETRIEDPSLHAGERQALALALEIPDSLLLMDERRGRARAHSLGLPVIGTLGALLKAKRSGLLPELTPTIDRLARRGYRLSPSLIAQALALAGED